MVEQSCQTSFRQEQAREPATHCGLGVVQQLPGAQLLQHLPPVPAGLAPPAELVRVPPAAGDEPP
jgi:hypothetical protein